MSEKANEHSIGPWKTVRAGHQNNPNYWEIRDAETEGVIAILDSVTLEEARLIAAAPELLEAARWAREHVNDPKALDVINEAIDKATSDHANGQS